MYAIVDIETTGGSSKRHGITEIAIILHDGEKETSRYETLINPDTHIPYKIEQLTGISNEMVADAPRFHEVAKTIWELTEDRVFVAHNVNFDYGFIREHFAALGAQWRRKKLCTVRLSRKLMPGLASYSLGRIADHLNYTIEGRHRAMGDCEFTAHLFTLLLEKDKTSEIDYAVNPRSREAIFPPNFNRAKFDSLPASLGVYIFKDAVGKVLYVGKAKDLRKRVTEHFRGGTHTSLKNRFNDKIEDLDWIVCPNELIALLTEAKEIKRYWPPYNNLLKRISLNWGVYSYLDQNGILRLNYGRVGKWDKPIMSYKNQHDARMAIERICSQFELCAKFCGLQESHDRCDEDIHGKCHGACVGEEGADTYNKRCEEALLSLNEFGGSVIIRGAGFNETESSIVYLERGRYKGHGMMPNSEDFMIPDNIKQYIESGYDDQDMQGIIRGFLLKPKPKAEYEVVFL